MASSCKLCVLVLALGALVGSPTLAVSEDTVFKVMLQKCATERQTYCANVTHKDIRIASCLYAHEDKVSAECAVAIYDGMLAMQIAISAIGSYARSCRNDLLGFCGSVKTGEGRLYACLVENSNSISAECRALLGPARAELEKLGIAN